MNNYGRLSRRAGLLGALASLAPLPRMAVAKGVWPSKTIKIICATQAGGLTDVFSRAYGDYLSEQTGQTVVVENKSGGGGSIAALALKAAEPDGHTLMTTVSTTLLGNRVLYKTLPYNPDTDFTLISLLPTGHLPLVAHKSTGATNVKEFIEFARNTKISFGSYAAGSMAHIICARLNRSFGLDMAVVNYRGEAPMWQDMHAGVIQAACATYAGATSVLDSGAGRAIAVPTLRRMRRLPDVATFVEQGLTDKAYQLMGWSALLGPSSMPKDVVERISSLMVEGGKSPKIQRLS